MYKILFHLYIENNVVCVTCKYMDGNSYMLGIQFTVLFLKFRLKMNKVWAKSFVITPDKMPDVKNRYWIYYTDENALIRNQCIRAASWQNQKMTLVSSEDSDQPGHPPRLIRVFAVRMKKHWVLSYPLSTTEDSDKTGRTPQLIRVFAGRKDHFVGFVMRRLIQIPHPA